MFRRTCGGLARVLSSLAREAMGAASARHSLRPLQIRAKAFVHHPGARVAGTRRRALFVSRAINVRTDAFSSPPPWGAGLSRMTLEGDGAPPHPERGRVGEGV